MSEAEEGSPYHLREGQCGALREGAQTMAADQLSDGPRVHPVVVERQPRRQVEDDEQEQSGGGQRPDEGNRPFERERKAAGPPHNARAGFRPNHPPGAMSRVDRSCGREFPEVGQT